MIAGALIALAVSGTASQEAAINPALALMVVVTFLQVPLAELGRAFGRLRFLGALLAVNFVAVPLLVAVLVQFVPNGPMIPWACCSCCSAPASTMW